MPKAPGGPTRRPAAGAKASKALPRVAGPGGFCVPRAWEQHHDHRACHMALGACLMRAHVLSLAASRSWKFDRCIHEIWACLSSRAARGSATTTGSASAALPPPRTQLFRPGGDRTGQRQYGRCQGWRSHPQRSGGLGLDSMSPCSRYTCIPPGRAGCPGCARVRVVGGVLKVEMATFIPSVQRHSG